MIAPARATPALPCWLAVLALGAAGCNNNPYPSEDAAAKVVYIAFQAPPKTLDPQVAYTTTDHILTGNIFDTLLEYHYLERPYRLIPGARRGGAARRAAPGRAASPIASALRPDVLYQDDACFALGGAGRTTRAVDGRRRRLRADAHRRSRGRQPGDRHLRPPRTASATSRRDCRTARARSRLRRPAGARAVRAGRRHRRRARPRSAHARDRARPALSADRLLVRHAVHRADAVGGGGGLRRPRRARRRSPIIRSAPAPSASRTTIA